MEQVFKEVVRLIPALFVTLVIIFVVLVLAKKFEERSVLAKAISRVFSKKDEPPPASLRIVIFLFCILLIVLPIFYKYGLSDSQKQSVTEWLRK